MDSSPAFQTNHRRFAAFWEGAVRHEGPRQTRNRSEVVSRVHGRVLELGVGPGANWRFLPEGVDYCGIEPDIEMLRRAHANAAAQAREWAVEAAGAESLPFPDSEFDSAFGTLVLCSVRKPAEALAELFRVLKPGAEYRFWEHVRPGGRFWGPAFSAATPIWSRFGAGCHLNRRTVPDLEAAGFEISELRATGMWALGAARKPLSSNARLEPGPPSQA